MNLPLGPEDVKIIQGHSGRGLQVVCDCGCINWNHLAISEAVWRCRNCRRLFTSDFPGLVAKVKALEKLEAPAPATAPAS